MSTTKTRTDEVYEIIRGPAEGLFTKYGITLSKANSKGWRNMSTCPWCKHGPDNYQCGIQETPSDKGYMHAVKCMHPHDSPSGESSPHYADFLLAMGALSQEDVDIVKGSRKGVSTGSTVRTVSAVQNTVKKVLVSGPAEPLGVMNEDNNARGRRRLLENATAIQYLQDVRGFSESTITRFKLGLSEPYEKDGQQVHAYALAAPLIGFDGRFYKKYVNYALPGVTIDNREKKQRAWSPGPARAYYNADARKKTFLFVCDGLKDVWALSQLIKSSPELDASVALVSSTNGGQGIPEEWKHPDFWSGWDKVFLGHDNDKADPLTGRRAGDEHARALAELACRETLRVYPTGVKDWNDWTLEGNDAAAFRKLLEGAEPIPEEADLKPKSKDDGSKGRFTADPISIVGAFNGGHMYEAIRTLVRDLDPDTGEMNERYDTMVIRSDRTTHRVRTMQAPKGTAEHNLVKRLYPDGTMVSGYPEPNPNLTWSWDSIEKWLEKKDRTPHLKEIVERIENHLRGSVWLPYFDDYSILACAVVASYVQQVFDAVPLVLVTGAAGTGKSELGLAMKSMGANSKNVLGVVTAATLARFIDSTRGLVVIDDLEDIAGAKDSTFGDLVQTLKLSYKKATAQKMVTEMKNGKAFQRQFNFFGIKVISNTRGVDSILGTRMLTIQTRLMPKGMSIQRDLVLSPEQLDELRNQLHCWAFSNVTAVNETYQAIFPNKTGRQEEISAPLRVIASLSGSATLTASLEKALERQERVKRDPDSPEDLLKEALQNIVRASIDKHGEIQTWVTVTQAIMEMSTLVDLNHGKEFTTSLATIEKPEWVGRQLRQTYAEDPNMLNARTNMYGKGLRAYQLSSEFLNATLKQIFSDSPDLDKGLPRSDDFKSFCKGCGNCPYQNKCDMQAERLKSEGKKSNG